MTVLNIFLSSHPVHGILQYLEKQSSLKNYTLLLYLVFFGPEEINLGTQQSGGRYIRRLSGRAINAAVGVSRQFLPGVYASPAAAAGAPHGPSPPGSCPWPPASLQRCSARSRDRSICPSPVRPGCGQLNFRQIQRLQMRLVCGPPDCLAVNASTSQHPRARSARRAQLKLKVSSVSSAVSFRGYIYDQSAKAGT